MMDRFKYKIYGQQCFNSLKELKQHLKSLTLIESDNLFYTTVYLFNVRVYICMLKLSFNIDYIYFLAYL